MPLPRLRLALFEPDIPQNAGTMIRLCACLRLDVDIVEPAGFPISDRAFRRAGMDYLDRVAIARHVNFAAFEAARRAEGRRIVLATTRAALAHVDFAFRPDDVILMGRESAGAPEVVHAASDARIAIPMAPGLRSLNVAVAAAMIVGEALRQTDGFARGLPSDAAGR